MNQQSLVIRKVLWVEYNITPVNFGSNWESIELEDGIEKPPKDEFDEKVSNFINSINRSSLRKRRNKLLNQSDKYTTTDYPHSNLAVQQEWLDYRQALRDLPSVTEDPLNPVWPVRPDEVVVAEEESSNVVVEEETSNVVPEEESSNVVVEEETSNVA